MPGGDGTGPAGLGPMAGRQAGYGSGQPLIQPVSPQMGKRRGRGRRLGRGRGMGRDLSPSAPPTPQQGGDRITPENKIKTLKAQARALEDQLRAINVRIGAVEPGSCAYAVVALVDSNRCVACGTCERICPAGAISVEEIARINRTMCMGCGQCVAECPEDALFLRKVQL